MSALKPSQLSRDQLLSGIGQLLDGRGSREEAEALLAEVRRRHERLLTPAREEDGGW